MPSSYEKINYTLRPAKCVERKMLVESFARLASFDKLNYYEYIGFGSIYFSDFVLMHKSLGLTKMISIEKEIENKERFLFNKPYSCIELKFGLSGEVLPLLDWSQKKILWLDSDSNLDNTMLSDIGIFCSNAISGSMVTVTVNVHPDIMPLKMEDTILHRLNLLKERVGREKVPEDVSGKDLKGWGKSTVCCRIVNNEIQQILTERNGTLSKDEKLVYKQLFNFNYQDGARMLTVGGIIFAKKDLDRFNGCYFKNLSFIRMNEKPYLIEAPCLTHREIRFLDEQLPRQKFKKLKLPSVHAEDIKKYERIYRYFPTFTEAEI